MEIFGRNANALGIVLAFETLEEEYLELLYFNGENKEWLNEDWMAIDFFSTEPIVKKFLMFS